MEILPILIGISIIFVFCAVGFFFWGINNGQYDDLDSPAHKILFDDDEHLIPTDAKPAKQKTVEKSESKPDV